MANAHLCILLLLLIGLSLSTAMSNNQRHEERSHTAPINFPDQSHLVGQKSAAAIEAIKKDFPTFHVVKVLHNSMV